MVLNLAERVEELSKNIHKKEVCVGKGLNQPFNFMNSSSRKIMQGIQFEHILNIDMAEVALVQTGYESEFGINSSSFEVCDDTYELVDKVHKFTHVPEQEFILVFRSLTDGHYMTKVRKEYCHITENYGFMYNTKTYDTVDERPHPVISKGEVISKSSAYDEFNNRMDGVNLDTAYLTLHETTEDGVLVSKSASKKMGAKLIKPVQIVINDNDVALNLYGDNNVYKCIPDIGEHSNGILCALRREIKEESLYTLSFQRLKDILISDEKFTVSGRVVDVRIYCNNPDGLSNSFYNSQLRYYYDELINYSSRIVASIGRYVNNPSIKCSYEMEKLYKEHSDILKGKQWVKDKDGNVFSNVIIEIDVLEDSPLQVGDKLSNRYGGKGVVSEIRDDELMPMNDQGEPLEIVFNAIGPVGRQNPGQLIELSCNFAASRLKLMYTNGDNDQEFINLCLEFINIIIPEQAKYYYNKVSSFSYNEKRMFVQSILQDGLYLSAEPLSDKIDMDKLAEIYRRFSFISPTTLLVPMKGANGVIRYVKSRRPVTSGKTYMYRLKQYAENKHSATSLSATNIKNEPTKPKTNKVYKAPYSKTPVRFGEMETGDMLHFLDPLAVVTNLMIHSTSPIARRLTDQVLTGDPFHVNIDLNEDCKNRNVEIMNAYLKTIGLRLVFKKTKKELIKPFKFSVMVMTKKKTPKQPFVFDSKGKITPFVVVNNRAPFKIQPFKFIR